MYVKIREKVFQHFEKKYGKGPIRTCYENLNIDSLNNFKCKYEVFVKNDLFTIEIWGTKKSWIYSITLLLECEEGDKIEN